METYAITLYLQQQRAVAIDEFDEALRYQDLRYQLRHLWQAGFSPADNIQQALQRAIEVCRMANINPREHFRPLYVFDSVTGNVSVDWMMSKRGFTLLMLQLPATEQTASWWWQLSDV